MHPTDLYINRAMKDNLEIVLMQIDRSVKGAIYGR